MPNWVCLEVHKLNTQRRYSIQQDLKQLRYGYTNKVRSLHQYPGPTKVSKPQSSPSAAYKRPSIFKCTGIRTFCRRAMLSTFFFSGKYEKSDEMLLRHWGNTMNFAETRDSDNHSGLQQKQKGSMGTQFRTNKQWKVDLKSKGQWNYSKPIQPY